MTVNIFFTFALPQKCKLAEGQPLFFLNVKTLLTSNKLSAQILRILQIHPFILGFPPFLSSGVDVSTNLACSFNDN